MTTHHRCDPPFPVVTPRGKGWAHWMIDRTQDHNLEWVVIQDDTGECWTYQNPVVRFQVNETMGRPAITPPVPKSG